MKSGPGALAVVATSFATILGAWLLLGCASKGSKQAEVVREGNKFYDPYLAGDLVIARQSLDQGIRFFQSPAADVLEPSGHAGILYFSYARLYALERRSGNAQAAEAALAKARFWNERRFELANATNSASLEERSRSSSQEWIMELADKLDNSATQGKGPQYIHYIQKP
jgi:hypothetical protein